ncbi:MAG: nucleotidyltransferase domain-containing protein [Candidatus Paceibacterota bacterium]|jgi:predicted nucleotidyltransferase
MLESKKSQELQRQILATIAYYDIFDYPLTSNEIFSYLIRRGGNENSKSEGASGDVLECLEEGEMLRSRIGVKYGFYFQRGRDEMVARRLERKKIADQKWKKARKIFWLMQVTPFLKGIFISGSLALGNSRRDSDIDLIVVAKSGRIWTVRTFITILTSLLFAKRHGKVTKDMICLNHYITDRSLKIPFESLYNAESYIHLVNLYKHPKDLRLFQEFQIENEWMGNYVENCRGSELGSSRSIKRSAVLSFISSVSGFMLSNVIGDVLEKKLSEFQSRRIKSDPLYKKSGGRITIGDDQLEFHPDSHERFVIPEFNSRMEKMGLAEFAGQKDSGLNK